jgi:hypothetical protein
VDNWFPFWYLKLPPFVCLPHRRGGSVLFPG